jgi:predicted regulator of Ras-like GTPase activity (Roadblock/LC7/MglB family)
VPFQRILSDLVDSTRGSIGAIFLDYEGETVQLVAPDDLQPEDLQFVGAWQGIFLAHLRNVCMDLGSGAPQRFKIQFERATVLSYDMGDGYYLVLLVRGEYNEGTAWRRIDECRHRLIAEM